MKPNGEFKKKKENVPSNTVNEIYFEARRKMRDETDSRLDAPDLSVALINRA